MERRTRNPENEADFDLTDELEAELNALARAARDNPETRNALYLRLAGKIARFLAPWRGRCGALGDFADLRQESFVLYADLVADWPGEGSFARYFLAFFPWRLRHAVAWHERRWPRGRLVVLPHEALDALARGDRAHDEDGQLALDALALDTLSPDDRRFLALRLAGHSLPAAARLLGWSERTAGRHWRAIRQRARGGVGA